jgi:hypothetical protein
LRAFKENIGEVDISLVSSSEQGIHGMHSNRILRHKR